MHNKTREKFSPLSSSTFLGSFFVFDRLQNTVFCIFIFNLPLLH